jgi:hypothetical protein
MIRVYNKRSRGVPADAVYVGRPSKWGNPFVVNEVGGRDRAIALHRKWLLECPAMVAVLKRELRGKSLVCWCAPLPCHADTLMHIANSPDF